MEKLTGVTTECGNGFGDSFFRRGSLCFMPHCVVVPWDSEEARRWEHRTGSLVPWLGMVASQGMVLEDSGVCREEAGGLENHHKASRVAF